MQHYVLGDVITEISERENNPSNSEYERFVGLEHYVSGEVEIENYGSTANLNSAMKVFNSGDILVARRNVYLKRASVVYFDGLTSGDSIVLRPKNETIGRILPFILNTDDFWDYAEKYSDGTMSKRLSPKVLKQYEFDLPDDNLEQLADILWAMVDVKKSYQRLLKQTDELVKSQFIEMFGDLDKNNKEFPIKKLSEVADYWNGLTYKPADIVEKGEGTIVLRSSNIQNGTLAFEDNVYVNCEIKDKLLVQDNDILMCSRNGSAALVGKTALIKGLKEPTSFGAFMMIIRSCYYAYLKTYFDTPFFRNQILTGTSTINQITGKMLNDISLPIPNMELVREFERFVQQSDKSKFIGFKSQFIEMFGDPFENPKGYKKVTIGDVCEFQGGSQPPRKEFIFKPQEGYARLIQIRDYKTDDYITYAPEKMCRKFCTADDIMIGRYGPPIFQILQGIEGAYNVALMKAIPHGVNKEFMRSYLKRDELLHHLEMFSTRTAGQAGIEMKELRGYPFLLPPEEEQLEYVKFVEQSDKSKLKKEQKKNEKKSIYKCRL